MKPESECGVGRKVILVTRASPFKTRLLNPSISAHAPSIRGILPSDGLQSQEALPFAIAVARDHLAKEAGMSRAAFARNFSASVGEPPHSYLTRWRMGIATQLLEETDLQLSEIASRVGYRSEFSFSRAFKPARGVSPIQYRRATPARSLGKGPSMEMARTASSSRNYSQISTANRRLRDTHRDTQ
jgi:AraC-like DNA-binding protein